MTPVEVKKFYIRYREGVPETEMNYAAQEGFCQLGVETAPFTWHADVDDIMHDLAPDVGLSGYIGDVWKGLARLGKPTPPAFDYPSELQHLLGRRVQRTTLGQVRSSVMPIFIKPVEHKVFTGFVHRCDGESRMRVVTCPDKLEVWTSEVVEFVSEHRVFILRGEILDVRRYKGNWSTAPNREVVEHAVRLWKTAPAAACLDVGVTSSGQTLLVEANDGFAFGNYGLTSTCYARMLSARWFELASPESVVDYCNDCGSPIYEGETHGYCTGGFWGTTETDGE